jgi:hypothetical protein
MPHQSAGAAGWQTTPPVEARTGHRHRHVGLDADPDQIAPGFIDEAAGATRRPFLLPRSHKKFVPEVELCISIYSERDESLALITGLGTLF